MIILKHKNGEINFKLFSTQRLVFEDQKENSENLKQNQWDKIVDNAEKNEKLEVMISATKERILTFIDQSQWNQMVQYLQSLIQENNPKTLLDFIEQYLGELESGAKGDFQAKLELIKSTLTWLSQDEKVDLSQIQLKIKEKIKEWKASPEHNLFLVLKMILEISENKENLIQNTEETVSFAHVKKDSTTWEWTEFDAKKWKENVNWLLQELKDFFKNLKSKTRLLYWAGKITREEFIVNIQMLNILWKKLDDLWTSVNIQIDKDEFKKIQDVIREAQVQCDKNNILIKEKLDFIINFLQGLKTDNSQNSAWADNKQDPKSSSKASDNFWDDIRRAFTATSQGIDFLNKIMALLHNVNNFRSKDKSAGQSEWTWTKSGGWEEGKTQNGDKATDKKNGKDESEKTQKSETSATTTTIFSPAFNRQLTGGSNTGRNVGKGMTGQKKESQPIGKKIQGLAEKANDFGGLFAWVISKLYGGARTVVTDVGGIFKTLYNAGKTRADKKEAKRSAKIAEKIQRKKIKLGYPAPVATPAPENSK